MISPPGSPVRRWWPPNASYSSCPECCHIPARSRRRPGQKFWRISRVELFAFEGELPFSLLDLSLRPIDLGKQCAPLFPKLFVVLHQHSSFSAEYLHRKIVFGIVEGKPEPHARDSALDAQINRGAAIRKNRRVFL